MAELKIPAPSEKQRLFLMDRHKYVGFGGARGGGKSFAVRTKAVLLCLRHEGIKCMIVRKTYPELTENHINPLCAMLGCYAANKSERIATYSDSKKTIVFPNGSKILFRYCDDERDADRFQGSEVDVLFIDEATQQPEEVVKKLCACVRGVNAFPKRVYLTANPGGVGHGWFKRLFIDRHFEDGESGDDYNFIMSRVTDNKALMRENPDYVLQLRALPPRLRAMWLDGDWSASEGQFFDDFRTTPDAEACLSAGIGTEEALRSHRWTHVIEPFDLCAGERRGWNIVRSYDFGYAKPFSCDWWAIDYDGVAYLIMQYYGCTDVPNEGVRMTPDEQFRRIAQIEREHPWLRGRRIDGVADPAIWDGSRGESVADAAMKNGVYFAPGNNERIPGWMQCHYRLGFDENGYARTYVFDTCRHFIRTVPLLTHSKTNPEDLDTSGEDHIADSWRYFCMSRPVKPIIKREARVVPTDPLNMFTKKG